MKKIILVPEWQEVAEELIRNKGIAIILGATDSGKSTSWVLQEILLINR